MGDILGRFIVDPAASIILTVTAERSRAGASRPPDDARQGCRSRKFLWIRSEARFGSVVSCRTMQTPTRATFVPERAENCGHEQSLMGTGNIL